MKDFYTFEEAMDIIRPTQENKYTYVQTRINHLILSGDLCKPEVFIMSKDGKYIRICSNNIRLVTAESVHNFVQKNKCKNIRPIVAVYSDGYKKNFRSLKKAMDYYDIYYEKINNILDTNTTLEIPLIGDRIKIVHEDADSSITSEFIHFKKGKR